MDLLSTKQYWISNQQGGTRGNLLWDRRTKVADDLVTWAAWNCGSRKYEVDRDQ